MRPPHRAGRSLFPRPILRRKAKTQRPVATAPVAQTMGKPRDRRRLPPPQSEPDIALEPLEKPAAGAQPAASICIRRGIRRWRTCFTPDDGWINGQTGSQSAHIVPLKSAGWRKTLALFRTPSRNMEGTKNRTRSDSSSNQVLAHPQSQQDLRQGSPQRTLRTCIRFGVWRMPGPYHSLVRRI